MLNVEHGLTFIELIVVLAIFSILSGITLFQFSGFTTNISLHNVSQDIALTLVRAQKDGSSGTYPRLQLGQIQPPTGWIPAFGVHFTTAQNSQFYYFFDLDYSKTYNGDSDCDNSGECLELIKINTGDKIVGLCIETIASPCAVNTDGTGTFSSGSVGQLDIVFKRPNLTANISAYNSSGGDLSDGETPISAKISIQSKSGEKYKIISIYPVGQITVN